jgi:hypothetical protein
MVAAADPIFRGHAGNIALRKETNKMAGLFAK